MHVALQIIKKIEGLKHRWLPVWIIHDTLRDGNNPAEYESWKTQGLEE